MMTMPDKIIDLTQIAHHRPHGATPDEWAHFDLILGVTPDLLPVVSNPNAEISPTSTMSDLGKTPSIYNRARKVTGLKDWTNYTATEADVTKWSGEPDYGICLQTRLVRAIDVDVPDLEKAARIGDRLLDLFGAGRYAMRRRSNSGKFLIAFTMSGEFQKRKFEVDGGIIEFLANGQQFIAIGRHASGVHYEWAGGLPDSFPVIEVDHFEQAFATLAKEFGTGDVVTRSATVAVDRSIRVEGVVDPVVDILKARNMIKSEHRDGRLNIVCPWQSEHTDGDAGAETSTQYNPAGVGRTDPGFKCLHAHCEHRTVADLYAVIGYVEAVEDHFEVVTPAPVTSTNAQGQTVTTPPPRPLSFARNNEGDILATIANVVTACGSMAFCGMTIGFDEFRDEIMFHRGDDQWQTFSDEHYVELRIHLAGRRFKEVGREMIRDAVYKVARDNLFDTATSWLNGLVWDGVPRVERFYSDYLGVIDSPYTRAVSLYTWSALAGRVLDPGCKADMVPIWVGAQGLRKSTGVAALAPSPDFFVEVSFHEKDEDLARKMRGSLVAEIGELRGLHTKELEAIKQFITRTHENWIPKYKEFKTAFPRRLVFIGTTNRDEFLADSTGNRRWLPVEVGRVDVDAINRDRVQLWAEAATLFLTDGVMWKDAENLAGTVHEKHMMHDSWQGVIENWLYSEDGFGVIPVGKGHVTTEEILSGALSIPVSQHRRPEQMRVADVMKSLGFDVHQFRHDGKRVRGWKKD